MEGLREQRSNSGNDQRDNLLGSLHECDTYKELKKVKKFYDIPNFCSRLEENFQHPTSKIREVTELLMDKYDEVLDKAFLAYGMDREFLLMHRNDIYVFSFGPGDPFRRIEFVLYNHETGLELKLFRVDREFYFHSNQETTYSIEGRILLQMNYEGDELEYAKKAIQEAYKLEEKEN